MDAMRDKQIVDNIHKLKNYGCGLDELMRHVPEDYTESMKVIFKKEVLSAMGFIKMLRFLYHRRKLTKQILGKEKTIAQELKVDNENFVKVLLARAANFGALCRVVGKEKALEINFKLVDKTTYGFMAYLNPTVEELEACGDPFEVFKLYMQAGIMANARIGIHQFEQIESTDDSYRFNISGCAFHAIPDKIGLGDACLSSCYGDEVFYPKYCEQFGVEFVRKGTIARGDKVCDFCFRRIDTLSQPFGKK